MKRTLSLSMLFPLTLSFVAQAQAASPALLAEWGFDEATGMTLVDSTSKGHDGTLINGAERGTDRAPTGISNRKSLSLNGSSYVSAPHVPLDRRSFSVTAWLNAKAQSQDQVWLSQGETGKDSKGLALRLTPDGSLRFAFGNDDIATPPDAFSAGTWHHVAYTFDAKTRHRHIYVDGVAKASGTSSGVYLGITGLTDIGRLNTAPFGSNYWNGSIDEVRIYDSALSAADVALLATPVVTLSTESSSSSVPTLRRETQSSVAPYYQTITRTERSAIRRVMPKRTPVRRGVTKSVSSAAEASRRVASTSSRSSSSQQSIIQTSSTSSSPTLNPNLNPYTVTSIQLHLRKDSRATAQIIRKLLQGEQVEVVQMLNNGWAQVKTADGKTGYVNASFIVKVQP